MGGSTRLNDDTVDHHYLIYVGLVIVALIVFIALVVGVRKLFRSILTRKHTNTTVNSSATTGNHYSIATAASISAFLTAITAAAVDDNPEVEDATKV